MAFPPGQTHLYYKIVASHVLSKAYVGHGLAFLISLFTQITWRWHVYWLALVGNNYIFTSRIKTFYLSAFALHSPYTKSLKALC